MEQVAAQKGTETAPLICQQSSGVTTILSDSKSEKSDGTMTTMDNDHGVKHSIADKPTEPEDELSDKSSAATDDLIMLKDELGALYSCLLWIQQNGQSTIEKVMKDWISPIYAFFEPVPEIEETNGRVAHTF